MRIHVLDQVQHSHRVSRLIVVPRYQFDKIIRQGNTGLFIKDAGMSVTNKVGRDNTFVGVTQDAVHFTVGCRLDGGTNGFVRGTLFQAARQIDNGDVNGGDPKGHAGQFPVEFRNDLTDRFCGTGTTGDDIVTGGTSSTPILLTGTVDRLLSGRDGVDRGHETLLESEFIIDNLGQWCETIGRTGCVGDDIHGRLVLFVIDTHDKHGGIRGWGTDDHLFGTTGKVGRRLFGRGKDSRRLDDVVGIGRSPLDFRGIFLIEYFDLFAVNRHGTVGFVV